MGWNAEARITALLFYFSAAVFLLLGHRDAIADVLLAALDRFHLDGRSLLDLATKRNMIMLCHAILLLILRDAGVLGAPARRRGANAAAAAAAAVAAVADSEEVCSAPPRPRANSIVVWRRPPNGAAPALAEPSPAEEPVATKQIVLVEQATTNHLAAHDRAAAVELQKLEAAASATDDESREFDRRIEEVELADDRRIEEFINKQWSEIRQESLQWTDTNMLVVAQKRSM